MASLKSVTVVEHPVLARDLTILRDKNTPSSVFRPVMGRLATILAYHALDKLPLRSFEVETPLQKTTGYTIDTQIIVVPILRAGLALVDAITQFIPDARIGHLGIYRDKQTHKPVDYYVNLPTTGIDTGTILLVDPMLATGGSAIDAIGYLKRSGAKTIRFMCMIAAPEGVEAVHNVYPDVPIITASIDEKLNENAYIIPGLGDAGDRFFGTN